MDTKAEGSPGHGQNGQQEADELNAHIQQLRAIFDEYTAKNKENNDDDSSNQGINYEQFKEVLESHLGLSFEDQEQFDEICANLDPHGTKRITFESIYSNFLEAHEEDDAPDDRIINDEAMFDEIGGM